MLTNMICWLVVWPLLLLRFGGDTPAPRPAPRTLRRPYARQWRGIGQLPTGRIVAVRVQVILA